MSGVVVIGHLSGGVRGGGSWDRGIISKAEAAAFWACSGGYAYARCNFLRCERMFTSRLPAKTCGYATVVCYAWSRRAGGLAEGVDITNANCGTEGATTRFGKIGGGILAGTELNTCTCNRFRVGGAEFGRLLRLLI